MSSVSFTAIGTPSSGRSSPAPRRASACSASTSARSAITLRKAFSSPSKRSIRSGTARPARARRRSPRADHVRLPGRTGEGELVAIHARNLTGAEISKTAAPRCRTLFRVDFDLSAARGFMAGHARRSTAAASSCSLDGGDPAAVLAAARRLPQPRRRLRLGPGARPAAPESQPGGALHAFEVVRRRSRPPRARAPSRCATGWRRSPCPTAACRSRCRSPTAAGCAPFWASADPTVSSLQITAFVAAHRAARGRARPGGRGHPWLARATDYCLAAIEALDERAVRDRARRRRSSSSTRCTTCRPEAAACSSAWARSSRRTGGCPSSAAAPRTRRMRALDFAPHPGRPARALFARDVIDAELRAAGRASSRTTAGGRSTSRATRPRPTLEWRGYATVRAVAILRGN